MRIMKILCGLMVMLVSISVHAEKFQANEIKFGKPQSSNDKTIYYGANGLHRYNETTSKFEMSTDGGSNWSEIQAVGGFADSALSNLVGPTSVNVPLLPVGGSSINMGSLLFPWGDIIVGYDTNSHFQVVDPLTSQSALEIGAQTSFYGPSWGINAPINANRLLLSLSTGDNPAGASNGIVIETGDATLAGDSGDILIKTGEENGTGGSRGVVTFNSSIVDFQNVATVDFTGVTVLGVGGGGGGGITWSTPVNATILPQASNTYGLGASNNFFSSVNGNIGRFATISNLTGVPINVTEDLTMTGRTITGLNLLRTDNINQVGASGINFNSVELKNVANPTLAQSVATKDYVDTELASAVGFNPSAIVTPLLPSVDNSIAVGSASKRWLDGFFTNVKSVQSIESSGTSSLNIKTNNQASGLSGGLNLTSGTSNLAGTGGAVLLKSGNNAIGASGNVLIQSGTAGTTRGEISLDGSQINANSKKIINVTNPTALQDVATKNYVDTAISSIPGGGGGTDWTVPINNNITVDGGNYNLGTVSSPLQTMHSQSIIFTDKTKEEMRMTTVNGTSPAGFGYEMALRIMGGNGTSFAMYGEDSAIADSSSTKTIHLETGNKTAGTGNSGDIYIQTGTSSGGDRGSIILDAGGVSLSGGTLIDVANPVDPTDAVNLQTLNTSVSGREGAITAGTTAQYWRGDKTFQTLNTNAVTEGANLYYTQGRFDTAFGLKTTTNLTEGTNLYYTQSRFDTAFGLKTTTNLAEGTNLYYTQGRFDTALGLKTTSNLAEGSNLYYTNTRADARIALQKGAVSGIASLDGNGKIPTSQLPPLALTDVYTAGSQVAQLAITPIEEGDVVIRTDLSKTYIHNGGIAGTMADFNELLTPTDTVLSVNGLTGAVSLTTSNITEGTNLYYTEGRVSANTSVSANTAKVGYTTSLFNADLATKTTSNLAEGTNLYFTNARAISAPITGFTSGAGTITATDTILQAIQKLDGNIAGAGSVDSVNGSTGVVVLDSDDIDEGSANLYFTNSRAKSASVVNSTAGSETDQAPSVSAMKTYVNDATGVTTTQALTNNASATNITGLVFNKANVKSAFVKINIERSTDNALEQFNETGELVVTYKAKTDTWQIHLQSFGDNAGVTFTVTSGGQVQYATTNLVGASYSANLRFTVSKQLAQ